MSNVRKQLTKIMGFRCNLRPSAHCERENLWYPLTSHETFNPHTCLSKAIPVADIGDADYSFDFDRAEPARTAHPQLCDRQWIEGGSTLSRPGRAFASGHWVVFGP